MLRFFTTVFPPMVCFSLVVELAAADTTVTRDTYIRAETDFTFAGFQKNAGGRVNTFYYIRQPTPLDAQAVVRMNRDTLYAGAVVDTEGGATVTIPEFPDDRYFSLYVVDNDHYAAAVFYESGTYALPDDTKYVALIQRIQIMDPKDPDDIALVNDLQNRFSVAAMSADRFPEPQWNTDSMLALRAGYEREFQQFDQYEPDWMGPRGAVNESTRHLGAAGAWGLFPEEDAVYINYAGPASADACYTATYDIPPNDAFWSITVYGADGFIKSDNNIINDRNVRLNDDGTFTAYFGSEDLCGNRANRVDITDGWNFLMRVYRPGEAVLSRSYRLPGVEVFASSTASAAKIPVTEENFAAAESDRYFSEHSAGHPVNSIRHSREPSGPDNQFVITENRDVLYSHAVVDTQGGATIGNPEWDYFSVIQIIDEGHFTVDVLYPGEELTVTPDMLSQGRHVFLNMRTGLKSVDADGLAAAHAHQDGFRIEAASAEPYTPKGFDERSLDATQTALVARAGEADKVWLAFGRPEEVDPLMHLIASAAGWGGLPVADATYVSTIRPEGKAAEGACSTMTLPRPPLRFADGGFFSVTTYGGDSWIVEENFALNDRAAETNQDGSITFRYNCPGQPNSLDVQPGWIQVIRLYQPESVQAILEYVERINDEVSIDTAD